MDKSFGAEMKKKASDLKFPPSSTEYQLYVENLGGSYLQSFEGCTDIEISAIAEAQEVSRLPKTYVEYLRHFGKRSGDLFLGSDVEMRFLIRLKKYAINLMANTAKGSIPKDAFVFRGQQGHTYWYFRTNNFLEDPPVYVIWEEMGLHKPEEELIDVAQLPYHDEHGDGWKHLSEFLTLFIRERESEKAYQEFLRNNT
jgi:hypothetical protein